MSNFYRISVIVPVYNSSAFLPKCVDSVLAQTVSDFELILIDDGSADRSGEVCDAYARQDNRVKVIHQRNKGQSAARNAGIELSSGEYFAFVDSDDYLLPDYLEYLLSLLESDASLSFSACNWFIVRNGKPKAAFAASAPSTFNRVSAFQSVLYHGKVDVSPWGKLFKRELFDKIRFPEGRIYEDTYVFGKILNASDSIIVGNEAKYFYVQHTCSTVNGSFSPTRLTYVDAVEALVEEAQKTNDNLEMACLRRITHAYLSVLRYMESCPNEYIASRNDLREKVLLNAEFILSDKNAPQRDKIAIYALKLGFSPFFFIWKFYNTLR